MYYKHFSVMDVIVVWVYWSLFSLYHYKIMFSLSLFIRYLSIAIDCEIMMQWFMFLVIAKSKAITLPIQGSIEWCSVITKSL